MKQAPPGKCPIDLDLSNSHHCTSPSCPWLVCRNGHVFDPVRGHHMKPKK